MRIPLEVLSIIIEEIEDKQDLLNLRLVSPAAHCQATPRAFRQLHVTPDGAGSVLGLIGAPHLAEHVHEIIFDIPEDLQDTGEDGHGQDGGLGNSDNIPENLQSISGGRSESPQVQNAIQIGGEADCEDEDRTWMQAGEQGSRSTILISVFNNLFKLPALGTLRLHFPSQWFEYIDEEPSPIRQVQNIMLEALSMSKPVPTLRCLEIRGLLALPNPSLESATLVSFLKPVQVFHLAVTADDVDGVYYDDDFLEFWATDVPTLFSYLPKSLTSLSLSNPFLHPGLENGGWDDLTFPSLTSLHLDSMLFLCDLYFNPLQSGLEAFILRHSTSLKTLYLENCSIELENTNPNPRTWVDIWNQFTGQMTYLEEFRFEPLPGRDAEDPLQYHGYAYLLIESGWVDIFTENDQDPPSKDADLAAHANLQNVIRERRIQTADI